MIKKKIYFSEQLLWTVDRETLIRKRMNEMMSCVRKKKKLLLKKFFIHTGKYQTTYLKH